MNHSSLGWTIATAIIAALTANITPARATPIVPAPKPTMTTIPQPPTSDRVFVCRGGGNMRTDGELSAFVQYPKDGNDNSQPFNLLGASLRFHFDRSSIAAGVDGQNLQPGECGFSDVPCTTANHCPSGDVRFGKFSPGEWTSDPASGITAVGVNIFWTKEPSGKQSIYFSTPWDALVGPGANNRKIRCEVKKGSSVQWHGCEVISL